jgi:hypothetical protein
MYIWAGIADYIAIPSHNVREVRLYWEQLLEGPDTKGWLLHCVVKYHIGGDVETDEVDKPWVEWIQPPITLEQIQMAEQFAPLFHDVYHQRHLLEWANHQADVGRMEQVAREIKGE